MTGTKRLLLADAIKEGVDNVCYQTSGSIAFSPISGGKTDWTILLTVMWTSILTIQTTVSNYKVALNVPMRRNQEAIDFMYAKTTGCKQSYATGRSDRFEPYVE